MTDQVTSWVEANRQWGRALNVAHIKYRLKNVKNDQEALFWGLVLARYAY